jgi:mono/diheme cytochrome c family protein
LTTSRRFDDDTGSMRSAWCFVLPFFASQLEAATQLPESGAELYQIGCAKCHGNDGRGVDPSSVGFTNPLPDFTDCRFASREASADWIAVTHEGGPARGFASTMPAFGEAFDPKRIEAIVQFMRGFCTDASWPAGELNLPLPLVTEKAFPEDEFLWTTVIDIEGEGAAATELVYERRVGARHQWEATVPFVLTSGEASTGGLSDLALGWKSAFHHTGDRILTAGAEVFFPTGDEEKGLGTGTVVVEPFLAFAQILPRNWFLQAQGGVELPMDTEKAEREVFLRTALGFSLAADRGFGRTWSPMLELVGGADFDFEETSWSVLPQMQVTLSARQHIRANLGVALPLNRRDDRATQLVFYFLWDWFDGGLADGW